jgi:ribonucleoside-diphosphate reductase alpha chain
MYSANGSVLGGRGSARITYKTINIKLAEKLKEVLTSFGLSPYITTNKAKDVEFNNGTYTCKESYDINIGRYADKLKFFNIIGFAQQYKMDKLREYLIRYNPVVKDVIKTGKVEDVFDFSEPINHWGVVNGFVAHNCSEFFGNAYNACNLGSINLYNIVRNPFTTNAVVDYNDLANKTILGITALDEILDYGYDMQPLDENRKCIDDWRSIGLGIFGLGDMLIALRVRYGSKEAVEIVDKVMKTVLNNALTTSALIAKEKGTFGKYNWNYVKNSPLLSYELIDKEVYDFVAQYGLRNGSLLSVAPTGSIATFAGLSGGAEPLFSISYNRTTHALEKQGKFFKVFAKSVEGLLEHDGIDKDSVDDKWIKENYPFIVTAHDISYEDRIKMQATMQKYVDNAISSTVNLPNEATIDDVFNAYMLAWKSGCKGLTVFRNGCKRTAILIDEKSKQPENMKENKEVVFDSITPIKRKNLPAEVELEAKCDYKHTACVRNMHGFTTELDGNLFEVFTFNSGGCSANIATITRLCSLALRSGIKVEEILEELKETSCPACMELLKQGRTDISKSCGNAIAEIIEKAYNKNVEKDTSGLLACPSCGKKTLRPEGRCWNCQNCGWSKCE